MWKSEMRSLIARLNAATEKYNEGNPIILDEDWDRLYFTLEQLEWKNDFAFPDSPTQKVYFKEVNSLQKVTHNHPMLSLDKTKSIDDIKSFLGDKQFIAMLKMDGLTCSLQYKNGELVRAETRGNGSEGEDITHNIMMLPSVPKKLPEPIDATIDGEVICTLDKFKEFEDSFKNSRNFAAGSIRLLNSKESSQRHLTFVAWDVIFGTDYNTLEEKLIKVHSWGFKTVPSAIGYCKDIDLELLKDDLIRCAKRNNFPIDGLVFKYNYCDEYAAAGRTSHHFRGGKALKFYDEEYETQLVDIEYTMGRTGVLTPVAICAPVEIDGCTVTRASLHNLSVMRETLGIPYDGQKVWIFKANEIIPQIKRAEKEGQGFTIDIPRHCPICGGDTDIKCEVDSEVLVCTNPDCEGKLVNRLNHFAGRKGLDIKGLSKATLEKLIEWGWMASPSDLFTLHEHREEWIKKPGFGVKSVDRVLNAIAEARNATLDKFIASLGIPMIGSTISKDLLKYVSSYEDFRDKAQSRWDFMIIPGIAYEKAFAIWNYDFEEADKIYSYMISVTKPEEKNTTKTLDGISVCITGKLQKYKNRTELQQEIESRGGKVVSGVTAKTHWLINNDINSTSSKNLTAQRLEVPIVSEDEFINLFFGE